MTGLSDTMTPGNLSSLAQSDAIAFRAEFQGDVAARGAALLARPGAVGLRRPHLEHRAELPGRLRRAARRARHLPLRGGARAAQPPLAVRARDRRAACRSARASATTASSCRRSPVRARMRYELASMIAPRARARETAGALRRALRLPQGFNPRASALAAQWRAASASDGEVLARAIDFLRAGPLRVHARAAAARPRTRSTSSCSTRAEASASTSPRRSCS